MKETNKYQTPLSDELLNSLPEEVRTELLDCINNIEFILRLISPDRKYAKDLPRRDGKIIVDVVNPHILEDMEYFRPTGNHFRKYGVLTNLRPNASPNSEFGMWLREETKRIWYGMVRPSDGEWITGDMYYYLNYTPIIQTKIRKGTNQGDRVTDFPAIWEGTYLWYHYMDLARNGGLYDDWTGAKHCILIARRGAGKSYVAASRLAKLFVCGENELSNKLVKGAVTAYLKEYLNKDGILNKFISIIDFCSKHTQFPSLRLKNSMAEMSWKMGYTESTSDVEYGTLNETLGISAKDNTDKARGKRSNLFIYEEFGCHIKGTKVLMYDGSLKNVEDIVVNDILMGDDNTKRLVVKLYSGTDQLYKITLSNGDYQIVNSKHPIYYKLYNQQKGLYTTNTSTALELLKVKNTSNLYIPKATIKFTDKELNISPYLLGLWLGDGDSTRISIANEDLEVLNWLQNNYTGITRDLNLSKTCKVFHVSTSNKDLYNSFKNYNLLNNKHIPNDFKINSSNKLLELIAGLIDTDGTYCSTKNFFEITQRFDRKHILDDIKFMCESNGLKCSLTTRIGLGLKKGVLHYRLRISGDLSIIPTKIKRKKGIKNTSYKSKRVWTDYTFKIEPYGIDEFYGFTIDKNNLFVLGDLTISHNTFPGFITTWGVNKSNVQEDDIVFGLAVAFGCVCANTKMRDKYGKLYLILDINYNKGVIGFKNNKANVEPITYIQDESFKECIRIEHSYGSIECSVDHPILCKYPVRSRINNTRWYETKFINACDIKEHYYLAEIDLIDVWGNEILFDSYLVGILIGDGSYGFDKTPVLSNCDNSVLDYVTTKYETKLEKSYTTKKGDTYKEIRILNICKLLRTIGIYGQTKNNKRLPLNYELLNKSDSALLLAGLFDTDGYIGKNNITLVQSSFELQDLVLVLLRKFGIIGNIHKVKSSKFSSYTNRESDTFIYVLEIKDKRSLHNFYVNIPIKILYKIEALNKFKLEVVNPENIRWRTIKSILSIGIKLIYNLTADDSHTYLANNLITHNTGGSEGSNFSGALEIIYNPIGYGVYALPNVFDRNSQGKLKTVFFFGAYLNRKGCYDENGVSDVTKALIQELKLRLTIKYNSTDPTTLTRKKAEQAITIQEAIMMIDATVYPVADLTDVLNEIDQNPSSLDDIWIGKLSINKEGSIAYKPSTDILPIREFPHKDNKLEGCIEIHKMPELNSSNKVYPERYIAGIDPYDDDHSNTLSLGSLFILDLWTDLLVFEYTGRPLFAEDFYENCRRALLLYDARCNYENNKKGLYTYFSRNNCLYLLTDNLDYLKDKDSSKGDNYGNKSKGTVASAPIKTYGRSCIRSWLLKKITIVRKTEDKDIEVVVPLLVTLRCRALIKELTLWNPDGNFDRHDALLMLMLLREDKLRIMGMGNPEDIIKELEKGGMENDPFFSDNYDNRFGKLFEVNEGFTNYLELTQ